jgi:uncharacterized integral membrane protein
MSFDMVDEKILAQFTKVAHAFQRWTGRTTYTLAKVGVGLAAIEVMADCFNHFHQFLFVKTTGLGVFIDFILFVYLVWRSFLCTRAEDFAQSSSSNVKLVELLPYEDFQWRLVWTASFLFTVLLSLFLLCDNQSFKLVDAAVDSMFPLGIMMFYYFIAVNPLPPGTNKIGEWVKGLRRSLNTSSVPA